MEDILNKEPDDLSEEERVILEENVDDLTDEQRETFGLEAGTASSDAPATFEEILAKDPADITDEDRTVLENRKDDLSEEQRKRFGIEVDFKEKFRRSTQESILNRSKTQKMEGAVLDASKLTEPTDEEMSKEFPDWDVMSDLEKKLAKQSSLNQSRFGRILTVVEESRALDGWGDKVDSFISSVADSGNYPEIKGKESEFRSFCLVKTRRNMDLKDLVKAFLFDVPAALAKPKSKGSLLEVGSGGGKKSKGTTLTPEEIASIRERNPKLYKRMIQEGKIKIDVD